MQQTVFFTPPPCKQMHERTQVTSCFMLQPPMLFKHLTKLPRRLSHIHITHCMVFILCVLQSFTRTKYCTKYFWDWLQRYIKVFPHKQEQLQKKTFFTWVLSGRWCLKQDFSSLFMLYHGTSTGRGENFHFSCLAKTDCLQYWEKKILFSLKTT